MHDINLSPKLVVHSRPIPGNGTGMKNCIPNYGNGNEEFHSQLLGTGMGMKNPFTTFGNRNGRLVFPGMVGNGNSRSPLGPSAVSFQQFAHCKLLQPALDQKTVSQTAMHKVPWVLHIPRALCSAI